MQLLRFLLCFLLLTSVSAFGVGCPSSDDDDDSSADDDDDSTGDDDDDDDTTGDDDDDDDDTPPDPISCDGSLPVLTETEPNDGPEQAEDLGDAYAAGFCIEATVTCGEGQDYADLDNFDFGILEAREATVTLAWTGVSDADKYLLIDGDADNPLLAYEEGMSGPETGTANLVPGAVYTLQAACWDGQDTPYTLTVEWDTIAVGDDDDSGDDDDDDSAVGDDDDSVGDDDDSVGDDDDSAVGDDDDSAPVAEILGNGIDDDLDGATDEYTFSDVYSLVLTQSCNCHAGSSHQTGWFFNNSQATAYSNLVNASAAQASLDRVEPGDSAASYLFHKISGTQASVGGSGSQMPLSGGPLSATHIAGIEGWIATGAAND